MQKPLFLNELSFSGGIGKNKHACRSMLSDLIKLAARLSNNKAMAINHLPDVWTYDLVDGYSLASWYGDKEVKRTERDYLRSSFDLGKKLSLADAGEIDCTIDSKKAIGALYTYTEDGIALSVLSSKKWETSEITADFQELDISSGEVSEYSRKLPHIAQTDHIDSLKDMIYPPVCDSINDAQGLLGYIKSLSDNVVVCDRALNQIKSLSDIRTIKDLTAKLEGINAYIEGLGANQFSMSYIRKNLFWIRPDTPNTLVQHAEKRTFILPDGSSVVFSWHFNLAPAGNNRGYIHWCPNDTKAYIGYIGTHIRTKKYKG